SGLQAEADAVLRAVETREFQQRRPSAGGGPETSVIVQDAPPLEAKKRSLFSWGRKPSSPDDGCPCEAKTYLQGEPVVPSPSGVQKAGTRPVSAGSPGKAVEAPAAPAAPQVTEQTRRQGQELLDKALIELGRGNTAAARRLAQEARAGNFGVQPEADAVLR